MARLVVALASAPRVFIGGWPLPALVLRIGCWIGKDVATASRTRTSSALRRALASALSLAIAASLGGCLFAYAAAVPSVSYVNYYAEKVFVFIEGTSPDVDTPVEPQKANSRSVQDCVGEGLRVETEAGVEIGRVTDQACPGWRLTIHEDGSLTYEERTP